MPVLAVNSRAKYDYEILETYEAGMVLTGYEVKSIKTGQISLKGSYVVIKDNEMFLINANISPYQPQNTPADYESSRPRKLLLHKNEIKSLVGRIRQKGLTLVPLRVYTKRKKVKLEFAVGKGKRKADKREKIKKRETKRIIERALRQKT